MIIGPRLVLPRIFCASPLLTIGKEEMSGDAKERYGEKTRVIWDACAPTVLHEDSDRNEQRGVRLGADR